jgi:MtN3 and saliva related transmembrane protein
MTIDVNHLDILALIANILNLVYNVPQMYKTYKRKTTKDISPWFLLLRIISSIIWVYYFSYLKDIQLIFANSVPLVASCFVGYYKITDMYKGYIEKNKPIELEILQVL